MLPFPYSPVKLVSPTRFRLVYAFIFGAISSTLLGLVFSSRSITVIKVQTHYLDIFVNTSEFSVEWRRLPCFQKLHQSLTSLSFPPSPLPRVFLFPSSYLSSSPFPPLSLLLPFPPPSLLLPSSFPPLSSSVVNPTLMILVYLFLYFPLFACVDTPFPLIGHIIGLSYTCILWVVVSPASHSQSVW